MLDNQESDEQDNGRPEHRLHRVGREFGKVSLDVFGIALQVSQQRGPDVL